MNLTLYVKAIYLGLNSIYSCTNCGGLCQITEDMKTDGQLVLSRLKGQDSNTAITKKCPFCGKQSEFKPLIDRKMREE